jgi:hypothetical protein
VSFLFFLTFDFMWKWDCCSLKVTGYG